MIYNVFGANFYNHFVAEIYFSYCLIDTTTYFETLSDIIESVSVFMIPRISERILYHAYE